MKSLITTIAKSLENEKFILHDGMQQRSIGDFLENETIKLFKESLKNSVFEKKNKKSLEDFIIKTVKANYLIDVKTTNIHGKFSMPNLTAVDKIKKKIDDGSAKYIYYIFINYQIINNYLEVTGVKVLNLFELSWRDLQVANLGMGQLQIRNMHKFNGVMWSGSKKEWIQFFKEALTKFYIERVYKTNKNLVDIMAW